MGFRGDHYGNQHGGHRELVDLLQEPIALQEPICYNSSMDEQKTPKFEPYFFTEDYGRDGIFRFQVTEDGVSVQGRIDAHEPQEVEYASSVKWAIFEDGDDDWVSTLAVLFGDFSVRIFEKVVPTIGRLYGEYKNRQEGDQDADAV
jgi:hypothetical protein